MSEINLSSFDPRYGKHIDKAVSAIENGNPTYAIDVCSSFLHKHPECLEVRKILRMAQDRLPESRGGIIPNKRLVLAPIFGIVLIVITA